MLRCKTMVDIAFSLLALAGVSLLPQPPLYGSLASSMFMLMLRTHAFACRTLACISIHACASPHMRLDASASGAESGGCCATAAVAACRPMHIALDGPKGPIDHVHSQSRSQHTDIPHVGVAVRILGSPCHEMSWCCVI